MNALSNQTVPFRHLHSCLNVEQSLYSKSRTMNRKEGSIMSFSEDLIGKMLGKESLRTIGEKAGVSSEKTQEVMTAALPLLLEKMKRNASDTAGAESLSRALRSHSGDDISDPVAFLKKTDMEDGAKIVCHVLGEDTKKVQSSMARSTGLKNSQVSSILSMAAPLLLSAVGGEAASQNASGSQLGSLLGGILGSGSSSGGGSGLLGSLLGGSGSGLLNSMFGSSSSSSSDSSGLGGSLLSGLFSSVSDTSANDDDGSDLLGTIFGSMTSSSTASSSSGKKKKSFLSTLLGFFR